MGVVERMGYVEYYLIVADFIRWAKAEGIPGRAGTRLRRGFHRGVLYAHHRDGPDEVRAHLSNVS